MITAATRNGAQFLRLTTPDDRGYKTRIPLLDATRSTTSRTAEISSLSARARLTAPFR